MADFDLPPNLQGDPLEGFNVANEYVADPLMPDGTYKGIITKVELVPDLMIVKFTVELQGNEGLFCTDGVTPIDGKSGRYTLWLIKKGDELLPGKFSPALTRRQETIRSIKKFSDSMGISIGTEKDIVEAIQDQKWLSIPVFAKVKSKASEGQIYNEIKKLDRIR